MTSVSAIVVSKSNNINASWRTSWTDVSSWSRDTRVRALSRAKSFVPVIANGKIIEHCSSIIIHFRWYEHSYHLRASGDGKSADALELQTNGQSLERETRGRGGKEKKIYTFEDVTVCRSTEQKILLEIIWWLCWFVVYLFICWLNVSHNDVKNKIYTFLFCFVWRMCSLFIWLMAVI